MNANSANLIVGSVTLLKCQMGRIRPEARVAVLRSEVLECKVEDRKEGEIWGEKVWCGICAKRRR